MQNIANSPTHNMELGSPLISFRTNLVPDIEQKGFVAPKWKQLARLIPRKLGVDVLAAAAFWPAIPFMMIASRRRKALRISRQLQDWLGFTVIRNHYYEPVFTANDLINDPECVRELPGIDWNLKGQQETLSKFRYAHELKRLEGREVNGKVFRYDNQMFGPGDAEALYCFIRYNKPSTIIEVGSGNSTLVVRLAIAANQSEQEDYHCSHICYEPFENSWLEATGAEIRRERIERADTAIFTQLKPNDIVFIDSSHVVRAMGDVECEFLRIIPSLPPGVLVHVHDIFSPRDYPVRWLKGERKFWTEQYLFEAFLSFNSAFEVVLAVSDMHRRQDPGLYKAFPVLASGQIIDPGSFWIKRIN